MEPKYQNQIEQYINGTLSEADRASFEQILKENPDLAGQVGELKAIEEGLNAVGMEELFHDMKKWEADFIGANSPAFGWKRVLTIAAVITLLILPAIYIFTGKKPNSEELFLAYYEPYEEMLTTRGNSPDSLGLLLADGMDAYNSGAYQLCTELLQSYLKQQPDDHRVALYLGIAQLEIDQMESAEANFIRAQADPAFRQQAQWYQALSYLKFNQDDKARTVLQSISGSANHYRRTEAGRLLKELN